MSDELCLRRCDTCGEVKHNVYVYSDGAECLACQGVVYYLRDKYGPAYACDDDIYMLINHAAMIRIIESEVEPSPIELAKYVSDRLGIDPEDLEYVEEYTSDRLDESREPGGIARYLADKARKGGEAAEWSRLQALRRSIDVIIPCFPEMTDSEIVARYEELAAAEDEQGISTGEWRTRRCALHDLLYASARHERVVRDAYARESRPPSQGMMESQRQEMLDFVVTVNTAAAQRGRCSFWRIYGRPKNRAVGFFALRYDFRLVDNDEFFRSFDDDDDIAESASQTGDNVEGDLEDLRTTFRAAGMVLDDWPLGTRPHEVEMWSRGGRRDD
jgi:hypothetical protein